ncbi:putative lipoprotein [Acinetobacter baumannii 1598530]|nr:putative lipoprotein [Acinetobacter baumannii 1598530]
MKRIGLISILGLSACGGDDSTVTASTPPKEEPSPVTYVTIKGTAISQDILSNATVTPM